jgi:S-(hydroxymethyl)glutathione dehydrogenase/alcohol dehydrogenase
MPPGRSDPHRHPLRQRLALACGVITGFGAVVNTARSRPAPFVVVGTGGVGLNCIGVPACARARSVIAVDLSDEKLAAAKVSVPP